jgi:hypothetical protein
VLQIDLRRHHHPSAAPGGGTIGPALAAAPAIAAFREHKVVGYGASPLKQWLDGDRHAVLGLVVGLQQNKNFFQAFSECAATSFGSQ